MLGRQLSYLLHVWYSISCLYIILTCSLYIRYTICFVTHRVSLTHIPFLCLCALVSLSCLTLFPLYHYNHNVIPSRTLISMYFLASMNSFLKQSTHSGGWRPDITLSLFLSLTLVDNDDLLIMQ